MDFEAHWKKPIPGRKKKQSQTPARWRKILAFIIDLLVFDFVIAAPLTATITVPEATLQAAFTYVPSAQLLAISTIIVTLFFCYLFAMQYLLGQTIGMMLCKLRIEPNQALWKFFVRNIFIIPVFPFILLWIIDPIFLLLFNERMSERWSRTRIEEA